MPLLNNTDFDTLFLNGKIDLISLQDLTNLTGKTAIKDTKIYIVNQYFRPGLDNNLIINFDTPTGKALYVYSTNFMIFKIQKGIIIQNLAFEATPAEVNGYYDLTAFV
jgi:hypothetical protein